MNIELKNISYNARLSEETHCFAATVYIDGVKAGDAENRGHGGMTTVNPPALEQRINAYAKTLPKKHFSESLGGGEYEQSCESIIDGMVTDYLIRRDMKTALKRKVLFTKAGTKGVFATKGMKPEEVTAAVAKGEGHVKTLLKDADRVLNCLPEDEAFAIYAAQPGA